MTPSALKALIQSDQTALDHFTAGRHAACASRCSEIAPKLRTPVAADVIQRASSLSGSWAKIVLARESAATPADIKSVCVTFLDWIDKGRTIDFDLPQVKAMLAALVAANLVTQAEADALDAAANASQVFSTDDVQAAMRS